MSNETDTSVETEQLSTETATETKPTSPFNTDGTLVENWNAMAPEGYEHLREDKTLPRIKKFWDLSSSYVNVRKQVPLDKMPRPNDTWGDDEWDEFYEAGGRPSTAGDYNITRPEEIPEQAMSDETINGYQDLFHKIGLSQKQVDAIAKHNNDMTVAAIKERERQEEADLIGLKDKLRVKWGRAYDQNVAFGNLAIDKGVGGDEGLRERVTAKINEDPDLIELTSNLGSKFGEHIPVEDPLIPTPSDIQTQINELMADPRYMSKDKAVRQPIIDRVMRLREQMNKDKGITG